MNPYLKELEKIEFIISYACTGSCKHCSEGAHERGGEKINPDLASSALTKITEHYGIKTLMCFGGEPLIYSEVTEAIMRAAKDLNIPHRQLITNGYFSTDREKISKTAKELYECGVNDLLLSVDAFHQESIPLDVVKAFANAARIEGIPIRLQPAWLVSPANDNPYNRKTREILDSFCDTGISVSKGNVIFPEGNAKKYLSEYFKDAAPENPYRENPHKVKCLSFEPNGEVLGENFYQKDIIEILENYTPNKIFH